ncbi:3-hydroxy-3-methylglutaryl-coenzyme A reductase [Tanacetum coccineum]
MPIFKTKIRTVPPIFNAVGQDPGQDTKNSHCIAMMEAVNGGKDLNACLNMLAIEMVIGLNCGDENGPIEIKIIKQDTKKYIHVPRNTATGHHRRGCIDNRLDHTPDSSSIATTAPKTASAKRSLLTDLSLEASLDTVW